MNYPINASESKTSGFIKSILIRTFKIAAPVWVMKNTRAAVQLLSILLIGNYNSETDLAAMGLAQVYCNVTGYSMLWGLSSAINTLSPQALGAKEDKMIGVYAQRSIMILLIIGVLPISIMWVFTSPILLTMGQDHDIVHEVAIFAVLRIPGMIFLSIYMSLANTMISIGKSNFVGYISTIVHIIALGLNWVFIAYFQLGIRGAAITQSIQEILDFFSLLIAARCDSKLMKYWTPWGWHCFQGWFRFLKLSFPSLIMQNVEWWSWEINTFMAGLVSAKALAAQSVLASLVNIVYFTPSSFSKSCSVLVGTYLGKNKPSAAKRIAIICCITGIISCALVVGVMLLLRRQIVSLFGIEEDVVAIVVSLLPLGGLFNIIDGVQCSVTGVIIGAGQQSMFAPIITACYWLIGIPMSVLLGFYFHRGLVGLWYGMIIAVTLHSISFIIVLMMCVSFSKASEEAVQRLAIENAERDNNMKGSLISVANDN